MAVIRLASAEELGGSSDSFFGPPFQGYTRWKDDGSPIEVLIWEGLDEAHRTAVLTHELGLVAGVDEDSVGDGCVSRPSGSGYLLVGGSFDPSHQPCDEEAGIVLAAGTYTLRPEESLREATEDAALWWNLNLDATVFEVR